MQRISQILDILVEEKWTHFFYLGLPISKENMKTEIWTKQIEKIKNKIQS